MKGEQFRKEKIHTFPELFQQMLFEKQGRDSEILQKLKNLDKGKIKIWKASLFSIFCLWTVKDYSILQKNEVQYKKQMTVLGFLF